MNSALNTAELPFIGHQNQASASRSPQALSQDWFLSLRHAQIPFHADDRLLVLYGHPLVYRLGLHVATERVLAGEPLIYLDGANTFDPFVVGRLARAHQRQPRAILGMIHVARAYTGLQMERLLCDCLVSALDRYQTRMAILSGLLDTVYDHTVPESEALRTFHRLINAIQRLTQQGYTLLCLCPPAPVLTRTSHRCLDQLRGQADRVIRVHEEQGLVKLEEEGEAVGHSWEIARTALELR